MNGSTALAPKDSQIGYNTYSFTINVPNNKIIDRKHFDIGRSMFGRLPPLSQRHVIQTTLEIALSSYNILKYDFRFEKTKAGKEHMHAILYATEEQALSVQSYVQKELGFPSLDPSWVCKYEATRVSPRFWIDYMTKEDVQSDEESPSKLCPKNVILSEIYKNL